MADRSEQLAGKAKEAVGKVTGDEEMESEGRVQDQKEKTKQNLEEARDKLKGVVEGVKDKLD
ncbi:MAG: CsbD family protein [Actinomycetota bacterium]